MGTKRETRPQTACKLACPGVLQAKVHRYWSKEDDKTKAGKESSPSTSTMIVADAPKDNGTPLKKTM